MKNKILLFIITLIISTNAGLCAPATRTVDLHSIIVKFFVAMLGVIVASVVIWLGLTVYNKIFVSKIDTTKDNEILKTPKTIEEAIEFFISKNRLK